MPSDQPTDMHHRWSHPLRLTELKKLTRVTLEPDAPTRAALAQDLGIDAIKKLRFAVELTPQGKSDWQLAAQLGATVVQPCVVTAAPVTTRLDEPVSRTYVADYTPPEPDPDGEFLIPEDDSIEPLPATVDLGHVMAEALALALPLYPRAEGAKLEQTSFTAPGVDPLTDDAAKPFAGLGALRDQLAAKDKKGDA